MNILVSACLLGVCCRYNGEARRYPEVEKLMEKHNLIPVCPEQMGGLSTPRQPSEVLGDRVVSACGEDLTEKFQRGAQEALSLAKLFDCDIAILKERSPSCGADVIYDGTFSGNLIDGQGITAALLASNGIRVLGESQVEELINKKIL